MCVMNSKLPQHAIDAMDKLDVMMCLMFEYLNLVKRSRDSDIAEPVCVCVCMCGDG